MKQKCKWLEVFNQICCNGDSPYVADNPTSKCLSKEDCKYYEEGDDK